MVDRNACKALPVAHPNADGARPARMGVLLAMVALLALCACGGGGGGGGSTTVPAPPPTTEPPPPPLPPVPPPPAPTPVRGNISTVAGGAGCENCPATSVAFGWNRHVTDRNGNLFIADSMNERVRRIDPSGNISTVAGIGNFSTGSIFSPEDGIRGKGDGGLAIDAELYRIRDIALDSAENIYINQSGGCIRRIDRQTGIITAAVASCNSRISGPNPDGIPAANFIMAETMAVDGPGNIYFSEMRDCRIRRVDHATRILTTVAGTGVCGISGDNGLATNAQIGQPEQIVLDKRGNLYINQTSSLGSVRRVDAATGIIRKLYDGKVDGMVADDADNVYLSGGVWGDSNVVRVNALTGQSSVVAGSSNRQQGFSGDGGPATSALFNSPNSLSLDLNGALFISNLPYPSKDISSNIRRVDASTGLIHAFAGNGHFSFSGDQGRATYAQLHMPVGVAHDANNNLYVTDSLNHRIRRIDAVTGHITTIAGTGVPGARGDGDLAVKAELFEPTHIALDSAGNIYVVTWGNKIRRIDHVSHRITHFSGNEFEMTGDGVPVAAASHWHIASIAFDKEDNLYISDEYAKVVRRVDANTGLIKTVVGNGIGAALSGPVGLALDSQGNLFLSHAYGHAIMRLDKLSGKVTKVWFDDAREVAVRLQPHVLVIDAQDHLYFSGSDNNIRYLNRETKFASLVAGTGKLGMAGDGGPARNASLNGPKGMTIDRNGRIIVADTGNNRIRKID